MIKAELRRQALELPTEERVDLAVELWESVGQGAPIPAWQRDLIRERLADLKGQAPSERSTPWGEVRRRIWPKEA